MTALELLESKRQRDDVEQHLFKLLNGFSTNNKTNDTLEQLFEFNTLITHLLLKEIAYTRYLTDEMAKALGE